MAKIPMIVKSDLSGKYYCVTKYKWRDESKGQFIASEKFEIDNQLEALGLIKSNQ